MSIVLDIVAFGIVIPVLPKLVESFVNNDSATAAKWVGLFGRVWALMQFLCAPVLGPRTALAIGATGERWQLPDLPFLIAASARRRSRRPSARRAASPS